ncbi:lysophospholipase [Trametes versicolor FP-101664 SS1]|uniref:lysophospholipase n=1 Tax=Trametes versicolor (strain FP-101664) TaxID=717944 RepID=UPI0004623B45|nr:lysophospholipase [Trametes versicolor FP-101664 SS1]EIW54362.1 lysophospholipase [Trametes versicolor FP-101664 SS1]
MSTSSSPTPRTFTEAWLPGHDGTKFYTRTYPAPSPRAVLLFVHGFAEHLGRYEWAHGEYASQGITVFTYDQRGFGRTALDHPNKSKHSAYGKTSWPDQLSDIEFWVKHLKSEYSELPLFLKGHSMGGGLALAFATRTTPSPAPETLASLSGIISSSPLLLQSQPVPKLMRYVGGKASLLFPNLLFDAPVPIQDLSHNTAANEANSTDPWIVQKGSLRGLRDMLSGGEQLLWNDHKHWPQSLPLLIVHGTADRVTSFKASEEFYHKVDAADKEFKPFEDGFHELVHEPDGVKERFVDECVSWLLKHIEEQDDTPPPVTNSSKL